MKLGKKTLLYSLALSIIVLAMTVGYMIFMLPGLYKAEKIEGYKREIQSGHSVFVKEKSYENVSNKIMLKAASIYVPYDGYNIRVLSHMADANITVNNEKIRKSMDKIKNAVKNFNYKNKNSDNGNNDNKFFDSIKKDFEDVAREFANKGNLTDYKKFIDVDIKAKPYTDIYEKTEEINFNPISDNTVMLSGSVEHSNNIYITLGMLSRLDDGIYVTFMPAMVVEIDDILSTVLSSLPMISAVLVLLVLAVSAVFSRGIVAPIVKLSNYTQSFKVSDDYEMEPLDVQGDNEIAQLSRAINNFCAEQKKNYIRLKNENTQKEVLLKAAAHQLKTPVAAGILLTDSMISNIGKYKDRDKYLPEVKKQLKALQKMVEDILMLNRKLKDPVMEKNNIRQMTDNILSVMSVGIKEKSINVKVNGEAEIVTDSDMLNKILDNLLINAVSYTDVDGLIDIEITDKELVIYNEPAHIDDDLTESIKEPFVSGNHKNSSGLGLYISDYYSTTLGYELTVENVNSGVRTILSYGGNDSDKYK